MGKTGFAQHAFLFVSCRGFRPSVSTTQTWQGITPPMIPHGGLAGPVSRIPMRFGQEVGICRVHPLQMSKNTYVPWSRVNRTLWARVHAVQIPCVAGYTACKLFPGLFNLHEANMTNKKYNHKHEKRCVACGSLSLSSQNEHIRSIVYLFYMAAWKVALTTVQPR